MAKFSVTCKQQCCTVPELRDSLEVLSSHQQCELESCWDQRSSSKKGTGLGTMARKQLSFGMVEVEDSGDNSRDHAWSLRGDSAWHQVPHKAPQCKNVNPRQIQPPSLCVQPALACVVSSGVDVTE